MKKRFAAVLIVLSLVLGLTSGFAFAGSTEDSIEITGTGEYTAVIEDEGGYAYFKITPDETVCYLIYSDCDEGDTEVYVYDSSMNEILYNDDYYGLDAGFTYSFESGETYYIAFGYLDGETTGSYTVVVEEYIVSYPEDYIEITGTGEYTAVIEEEGGYAYFKITPDETVYYLIYSDCDEGDTEVYVYDSSMNKILYNDDYYGLDAGFKYSFESGETYYIAFGYLDGVTTGSYTVVVKEYFSAVSAQLISDVDFEVIEGIDSYTEYEDYYYDEETEDYYGTGEEFEYYYYYFGFNDGDQIIITFSDGSKETYTYENYGFYDEDGNYLGYYFDDDQYETHWETGNEYTAYIVLYDHDYVTIEITVSVIENPYESAELILTEDIVLVEGVDSYTEYEDYYYDEYDNFYGTGEFEYYYLTFSDGDQIVIYTTDGETISYTYSSDDDGFISDDGEYLIYFYDDEGYDQYDEHWQVGGTYYFRLWLYEYGIYLYVPVTIASSDDEEEEHVHDLYVFEQKDATCVDDGYIIYACTGCDDAFYEEIPATGEHTYTDYEVTVEPTCTSEGEITYTCTVCGGTYTESIDKIAHSYDDGVVTEATCTEGGYTTYTCTVCGQTYTTDETDALGHDYIISETDATCTDEGSVTYTCSRCGDTYTETVAALGHDYVLIYTTATCTEDGISYYECSRCDETKTEYTAALGHSYDDGVITKAATCAEEGEILYTCTVCGYSYTEVLARTDDHSYDDGVVTIAATCTEDGEMTYTCTICGDTYTEVIEAAGHTWDEGVITEDATCTEGGTILYTCTVCGETYVGSIAAYGHSYDGGVITKEAEVGVEGEITYTCTVCGYSYTETIAALEEETTADGEEETTAAADEEETTAADGSDDSDTDDTEAEAADVGDASGLAFWMALAAAAALSLGVIGLRRRSN